MYSPKLVNDKPARKPNHYEVSVTVTVKQERIAIDEDDACAITEKDLLDDLEARYGKRNVTIGDSVVIG